MSAPESRVAGSLIIIGYTGIDALGDHILVEPDVFVEQDGVRIRLKGSMIDLVAYHRRRASECVVNNDGTVALPEGFQEGKRAAINAKPWPTDGELAP